MAASLEVVRRTLRAALDGAGPGNAATDRLCTACTDLVGVDGAALSLVYEGASRGTFGASDATSRRLDDHQFTFGEGPALDAVSGCTAVLVPDLASPLEGRWPVFTPAALEDGVRSVFALPIMITTVCVGALDLFRGVPGPLLDEQLAGAVVAAEMASEPLRELLAESAPDHEDPRTDDRPRGAAPAAGLDRMEVYQATGMVIAQLDVDAEEALVRLRAHAIATGRTASEVAWAIIEKRLVLERDDRPEDRGQWPAGREDDD